MTEMTEINDLTQKLFQNQQFNQQLKNVFEKLYQQKNKNSKNQSQEFLRPHPDRQSLQLNEKCIEEPDELHIMERYSMSSSAFSKRESRDSISSMTSNPFMHQYMQGHSQSGSLNQITSEIASILSEMIKRQNSLHSKNTTTVNNSSQIIDEVIEKMQLIQKQQIELVKKNLEQKLEQTKNLIQNQVVSIIEKMKQQRKEKKKNEKVSQVKKQRRKVAQSILQISKNNQEMSTFSNIYEAGNILSDSQEEQDDSQRKNSPQLSHLSEKLSEVERSQSKISKEFQDRFSKQVQQNCKDIQSLTEKIIEWKTKNEEKLQIGFDGLWNVVTDITDKVNKVALRMAELEHSLSSNI